MNKKIKPVATYKIRHLTTTTLSTSDIKFWNDNFDCFISNNKIIFQTPAIVTMRQLETKLIGSFIAHGCDFVIVRNHRNNTKFFFNKIAHYLGADSRQYEINFEKSEVRCIRLAYPPDISNDTIEQFIRHSGRNLLPLVTINSIKEIAQFLNFNLITVCKKVFFKRTLDEELHRIGIVADVDYFNLPFRMGTSDISTFRKEIKSPILLIHRSGRYVTTDILSNRLSYSYGFSKRVTDEFII